MVVKVEPIVYGLYFMGYGYGINLWPTCKEKNKKKKGDFSKKS